MNNHNFTVAAGETFNTTVEWLDENDAPIDLTGSSVAFILDEVDGDNIVTYTDADAALTITAAAGIIVITLTPEQNTALPELSCHRVRVTDSGGQIDDLLEGFYTVTRDAC